MVVERLDEPANHKRILACSVRPEVHATGFANFARMRSRVAEPAPLLLVRAIPLRVARPTTVEAVTRGNHHPRREIVGVALAQRRADKPSALGIALTDLDKVVLPCLYLCQLWPSFQDLLSAVRSTNQDRPETALRPPDFLGVKGAH